MKIDNGSVMKCWSNRTVYPIKLDLLFNENYNILLINDTLPSFQFFKVYVNFKQWYYLYYTKV